MTGSELREIRHRRGLTQADAADLLGLSAAYVGELERDEKPIDSRLERRIAEMVRTRIDVSYSEGLSGWTVTVTAPLPSSAGPPGRRHTVIAKYATEEEAVERAERLREDREPGAKITIYPRMIRMGSTMYGGE